MKKACPQVGFQYQPDPVAGITKLSFWEFPAEGAGRLARGGVGVGSVGFFWLFKWVPKRFGVVNDVFSWIRHMWEAERLGVGGR